MADARDPTVREKAHEDFLAGMPFPAIADRHGVALSTVKSWAQRHWYKNDPQRKPKPQPKLKCGAPKGSKNAKLGVKGAHEGEQRALTHGMRSRYLPAETLEIMADLCNSPKELLWFQIEMLCANIVRAQRIMHVASADDHNVLIAMEASGKTGVTTAYEHKRAADKYATFLAAHSRAVSELRSCLKLYVELDGKAQDGLDTKDWREQLIALATRHKDAQTAQAVEVINDVQDG
ncbi:MAG: terminase [Oscillospiraceae bacterium]|jgi:uncharacterized protein YjcR|nr:terminase [Oscillospiraceae bacterium]